MKPSSAETSPNYAGPLGIFSFEKKKSDFIMSQDWGRLALEMLRQRNILLYGPQAIIGSGGSGGGLPPPGPPKRVGGCASGGGKKKNKKKKESKKTKNNKSGGGGGGGGGVTKGQAVPGGRGPGGSLSRAQRSLLRQAGLMEAVEAGLITFAPAPAPAPAPTPTPGPASGEAMDVEMGGPEDHV
ncbi:uncharacterized protein TrAFT101_005554 [Trichoderma asperellum]|uniref:uncharacterized protein n=1 Tax=Trichoderma asperellum TaxID=101201 RepID=UPI00332AC56E|nr:hypothetical protein TrAFT101_005554 [Trichoderma asperellum]